MSEEGYIIEWLDGVIARPELIIFVPPVNYNCPPCAFQGCLGKIGHHYSHTNLIPDRRELGAREKVVSLATGTGVN